MDIYGVRQALAKTFHLSEDDFLLAPEYTYAGAMGLPWRFLRRPGHWICPGSAGFGILGVAAQNFGHCPPLAVSGIKTRKACTRSNR